METLRIGRRIDFRIYLRSFGGMMWCFGDGSIPCVWELPQLNRHWQKSLNCDTTCKCSTTHLKWFFQVQHNLQWSSMSMSATHSYWEMHASQAACTRAVDWKPRDTSDPSGHPEQWGYHFISFCLDETNKLMVLHQWLNSKTYRSIHQGVQILILRSNTFLFHSFECCVHIETSYS